ncbi:MAG: CehA/McbA family metallohydrolase [Myxococcota bacterium]|nr:CehA/McbA family metallohydrolase [Myxococcota bacterium]
MPPCRALAVPLLLIGIACDSDPPQPAPRAGSPGARWDVVEDLRADLAAPRHPSDGGGRAWLVGAEGERPRVEARSSRPWHFAYEVGPEGVAEGGVIYFNVSPFWGWSAVQMRFADAPGYTEVRTDAEDVELDARVLQPQLLALVVQGRALREGERIEILYGVGRAGARADKYAEHGEHFWFAVDGDGDGVRELVADSPTLDVTPGPPAMLLLHGPSSARPGETVQLTLAVLDTLGNAGIPFQGTVQLEAPDGVRLPEQVELRPEQRGRVRFPVEAVQPGLYRIGAVASDELAAESNPLLVAPDAPRLLWGDLHGHSNYSDGTGTPTDYFEYARDVAALDVVSLTDHDHWGMPFLDQSAERWAEIGREAERFHDPPRFLTLHGFEWTSWIHGHRHVLFFGREAELLSSIDPATDEPAELWDALRGRDAMTLAHHSAGGPIPTDWSVPPDPELEPVTEIVSVHGSSEAPDSPHVIYQSLSGNFVRDVLAKGYRLGFVGSGDTHDGHPGLGHLVAPSGGLAGIWSETRSRAGVLEALRARRVYATNGPRILLEATLGGRPMGALLPGVPDEPPELLVRVAAVAPLDRLDIVQGGRVVDSIDCRGERDLELRWKADRLVPGDHLYVRAVQRGGGAAWSSPFFVE